MPVKDWAAKAAAILQNGSSSVGQMVGGCIESGSSQMGHIVGGRITRVAVAACDTW